MTVSRNHRALHVGIVGAGIAGLGAAIALSKKGHNVTLFEKSTFKREIGAAITMTPNANRVLDAWGFDAIAAGQTRKLVSRSCKLDTLEEAQPLDLSDVPSRFEGYEFDAFHRVSLHEGMRDLASQAGAQFQLGHNAVDVECDEGIIVFEDGTKIQKDLVILADGIRTRFIRPITGQDIPTKRTNKSIYRTLIPVSRIQSESDAWDLLWKDRPSGFLSGQAGKVMIVTYPCANDTIMNVAVFHDTPAHLQENQDWNSPATLDDVLAVLEPVHPCWRSLASLADEWKSYTIGFRDVIPNVANGKAVMIGDAAHPMQPTHAQGGSTSIEDAAALGELFSEFGIDDKVEDRLKLYEQFRMPRNITIQTLSNMMFYTALKLGDTSDPTEVIRKFYKGPILDRGSESWGRKVQDFFYSYDIFREARKAMQFKDSKGGIPEGAIRHFGRYQEGEL